MLSQIFDFFILVPISRNLDFSNMNDKKSNFEVTPKNTKQIIKQYTNNTSVTNSEKLVGGRPLTEKS